MNFFQILSDKDKDELRGLISEAVAKVLIRYSLVQPNPIITRLDDEPWRCESINNGLRCSGMKNHAGIKHGAYNQAKVKEVWD